MAPTIPTSKDSQASQEPSFAHTRCPSSQSPSSYNRDASKPVHSIYPLFISAHLGDGVIHALAGASAGVVSGMVTCPLDVIKTKLQAQGGFSLASSRVEIGSAGRGVSGGNVMYRGLLGTARMIWTEEGLRGMYRGLGPLILGYLPTWMVYFTVYEKSKEILDHHGIIKTPWVAHLTSATLAGSSATIVTNPIWVVKTRLMSQGSINPNHSRYPRNAPYHYTSTLDAVRKIYTHEGIRAFYSGLGPALLGLTHVAVHFPLYEYLKKLFTGNELGKRREGPGSAKDFLGILAATLISKVCASSATYPHEVLRTRLQNQRMLRGKEAAAKGEPSYPRYKGIIHGARTVYREEGWRAFYAGMGTNMIRALPASAVTLLTYELIVATLIEWKEEGTFRENELKKTGGSGWG